MDRQKMSDLIAAIYLDVITGDVHTKNQYMNTLITHISVYLRIMKLEPNQSPIMRFRTRLHNTISHILHNNHPLPIADSNREVDIRKLMAYFDIWVIRIDDKLADAAGVEQIGLLEDIEALELAMNLCYSAASDYSNAMSGVPLGLTDVSNKYSYIINLITPIVYRYDMISITSDKYANAALLSAKRIEPKRNREIQI